MPRCFSKCRKIKEEDCVEKQKCKYINGNTRKYCRLSTKYKMDKSCNVTRKFKKGEAAAVISRFGKRVTEKRLLKKKSVEKKAKASSTIGKFMRKNPVKMRRNFLMNVCANSGECIAVGREMKTIRDYFEGFSDFHYLQSPVNQIGKVSANGFVKELKYTRGGYSSYAILKSARNPHSDNLVYEYQVGQYINKLCNYFPCFLETYGLYYYKDEGYWKHIRDSVNNSNGVLKNSLQKEVHVDYEKACESSKYAAILIQHISNASTLYDLLRQNTSTLKPFLNKELVFILFQIYYPLSLLSETFTHYDLHLENVMLYNLDASKYIHYHYHLSSGRIVSFKSRYIVKIIDYGRSYFKDVESNIDSKKIRNDELCKIQKCRPNCGENVGFGWLKNNLSNNDFYIDSTQMNNSHDLRLINSIKLLKLGIFIHDANFSDFFTNTVYGKNIKNPKDKQYGTKPAVDSYVKNRKIQTVNDALLSLDNVLTYGSFNIDNESAYRTYTKIGDLHIYGKDKPMKYEPV